jgi:anaerobic C4-dicarboxylate transporter DcuA
MGDATYLAAVGVGTMIFNLVYWVFGFLRMGTSGMTAQAWGGRDLSNVKVLLKRSTTVSLGIAALILLVGKADVRKAMQGNVFASGMNAMVSIFGVAWMGSTFFEGHYETILGSVEGVFTSYPLLFAIPLFLFSIMLFSQAATVKTLYPVGLAMGVPPMVLLALFPAVNGYFFLPNYPTEVAAIGFDRTGTTRIGKYVVNHSFQLAGWITTLVGIGVGFLIITILY